MAANIQLLKELVQPSVKFVMIAEKEITSLGFVGQELQQETDKRSSLKTLKMAFFIGTV